MKRQRTGLTLVELLTVVAIIAILLGLLVPAVTMVRTSALRAKQKAQITAIEVGLTTFKNDYGDYPPSSWTPAAFNGNYCGAQKLSEALLGWDLLGFHPSSGWNAEGSAYGPDLKATNPDAYQTNLSQRKGRYLELQNANAFRLGNVSAAEAGLFSNTSPLAPNTYVLCDVFSNPKMKVVRQDGKVSSAGMPILYYRADSTQKSIRRIYDVRDNDAIVELVHLKTGKGQPLGSGPYPAPFNNQLDFFYGTDNPVDGAVGYIQDPSVTATPWPYKPDSYLLITAGQDGIYGTPDDICNFGD